MKRIGLLSAMVVLLLPVTTTAFAQDADEAAPASGDEAAPAPKEQATDEEMPSGDSDASATTSAPAEAPAAAPSSDAAKPISVGLLLGYGLGLDLKGGPNPWGLGFGARGGYNIGKVFLGARFVFYLGGSKDIVVPATTFGNAAKSSVDLNVWELGIEGGYDFSVGEKLTIRPELGFGVASVNSSVSGLSQSTTKPYFAPGASVLYDVSDSVFIGLDARFQLITSDPTAKAFIFLANGGLRF
jgi:opacity protein-like surface antigen